MVGGVCEICGSHSGNEEYKCLVNVTHSSLIDTYKCFIGTCCLHTMDGNSIFIYNANICLLPEVWCHVPEDSHLQGTCCLHILKMKATIPLNCR